MDVSRRSHDEQVHVLERGDRIVDRDELDLTPGLQCARDLLGDALRIPEPRLVDDE
jgi:hypothetical protein